jgi:large conductance mechanosensitive channel
MAVAGLSLLASGDSTYHRNILATLGDAFMGLLKEFRDFALRGNVIDMAVGVIIGGAFGKIVNSFVSDILMPPLGRIVGSLDFKRLNVRLFTESELAQAIAEGKVDKTATIEAIQKAGLPVFAYGAFLTNVIDFLMMAVCVFIMVKAIQMARERLETKKEEVTPTVPEDVKVLREIRDLLAKR